MVLLWFPPGVKDNAPGGFFIAEQRSWDCGLALDESRAFFNPRFVIRNPQRESLYSF